MSAGFETQLAFHIARFPGRDGLLILQELLNAHPKGWGRCLACFLVSVAEQAISLGKADLQAPRRLQAWRWFPATQRKSSAAFVLRRRAHRHG